MEKRNIYEYRIIKLNNGLNECGYIPQVRDSNNLIDRFFNYINSNNRWQDISTFCKAKVRGEAERLLDAKDEINRHKQNNQWIEEIINID